MIGGIILAAGSSRRFGDDKRKSTMPSGQAMLEESIHKAISALDKVVVVLRFGDREYAKELEASIDNSNVSFLCAPDSAQGMAHSLANAIHQVKEWEAAIVFLGDMPFVQAETIDSIMGEYQFRKGNSPIVLPTKEGERGHPVLFCQDYFDEIQALRGDRGARVVVDAHPDNVFTIEVLDPGVIRDIDTPADLGG
ncbi:MAG: nucleotidyltransferase family protein [Pseudomonadales bacterium]|nr:nucleotidyltransferase family protein [Pseudomonadales bacterium]